MPKHSINEPDETSIKQSFVKNELNKDQQEPIHLDDESHAQLEQLNERSHRHFTFNLSSLFMAMKKMVIHHKEESSPMNNKNVADVQKLSSSQNIMSHTAMNDALHKLNASVSEKENHANLKARYGKPCMLLGKGSYGHCWLVKRSSDHKMFAVKEFKKRKHHESEVAYFKRLTSEFCIASVLHHGNIIETVDIIFEKSHVYEVMELCEGGDLFEAISSSIMTTEEINCVFAQLIHGVSYLHGQGICHRDLKPENCMFDSHNQLKIIDFGCAEVLKLQQDNNVKLCRGRCGSTPYMAPEEFLAQPYDGFKVDVWACGIIYFTMLSHRFPWHSATLEDPYYTKYLHNGCELPLFDSMIPAQRELICKMLEPDRNKRVTIQDILDNEWFKNIVVCQRDDHIHHHGSLHQF